MPSFDFDLFQQILDYSQINCHESPMILDSKSWYHHPSPAKLQMELKSSRIEQNPKPLEVKIPTVCSKSPANRASSEVRYSIRYKATTLLHAESDFE